MKRTHSRFSFLPRAHQREVRGKVSPARISARKATEGGRITSIAPKYRADSRRNSSPITPARNAPSKWPTVTALISCSYARLTHTAVSWNTPPPFGRPGSALVSALIPIPSSNALFGQIPSTTMTPR